MRRLLKLLTALLAITIGLWLAKGAIFARLLSGPELQNTSWIRTQFHDVAYAPLSPAEKLDLYLPNEGTAPYPLIVAIHGGAFLFGDKSDGQQNAAVGFVHQGFAVAAIDYRMADEAKFPAAIEDAKAAIRFLRAHAGTYHLDANRVIAWGDSAGAYLAAMLGTTGGNTSFDNPGLGNQNQSSAVQAVIDWFGPIDFAAMDTQFRQSGKGAANHGGANSPESRFLGIAINTAPAALLKAANPLSYATAGLPPVLIEHGGKDATVPTEQSIDFAGALNKLAPGTATLVILPAARHADPAFDQAANLKHVTAFLKTLHAAAAKT